MGEPEDATQGIRWFQFDLRLLFVLITAICIVLVGVQLGRSLRRRDTLNAGMFPMAVGHKWTYSSETDDVTFEVLRTEKRDDANLYVVRRTIGKTDVEFTLSVEEDGVYIHREATKEFHPPLRQFAFVARPGDEWKWRGMAGGKPRKYRFEHLGSEQVEVPLGAFAAVQIHQTDPESIEQVTYWLSRGIGVVKLSGKTELQVDGPVGSVVEFDWALKKFERNGRN
jgi:hypothetical protein